MGKRGPDQLVSDEVMEYAELTEDSAHEVIRRLRSVQADGRVSLEEARWVLEAAERTADDARAAVVLSERAAITDRLIDNLKRGRITPHVARRARQAGITLPAVPGTQTAA